MKQSFITVAIATLILTTACSSEPGEFGGSTEVEPGKVAEPVYGLPGAAPVNANPCMWGVDQDREFCYERVCNQFYWDGGCQQCLQAWADGSAQCAAGYTTIYRSLYAPSRYYPLNARAIHIETSSRTEANGEGNHDGIFIQEAAYHLAATPQPGANPAAIYRCWMSVGEYCEDFLSLSPCEGAVCGAVPVTPHGYSYPPGPNVRPLYRCRIGLDHFISFAPDCEGQVNEGMLAYAW